MHRSRLLFVFSLINFIAVFACVLCLPTMVIVRFDTNLVVTDIVNKWYNIIIPIIQLISCGVILYLDIKNEDTLSHNYRYIVAYVAVSVAEFYTWIIICLQFSGYAVGDKISLPLTILILLPIALFMIAYGYYQFHKNINSKSIFGYFWIKSNPMAWRNTHRLAGIMCIATGFIIMTLSILNELVFHTNWIYFVVGLVFLLVYYLVVVIYSLIQRNQY